jgi:HEAT repeat protein
MRTFLLAVVVLSVLVSGLGRTVRAAEPKPTANTGPTEVSGKSLKQWVEELSPTKTPDPGFRHRAIQAITLFEPETASKEAGAALINLISDPDTSIRTNALLCLAIIGVHKDHTKAALPALIQRMNEDSQGIVRLYAAYVLGTMGSAARDAIPALVNRSKDLASYEIRKICVTALAEIGADDGKNPLDMRAVNALVGVLTGGGLGYADRSAEVRLAAVSGLGAMGIPLLPAEKAAMSNGLQAALKDPQVIIRIWARVGIMKIDGVTDEHLKELLPYLRGKDATAKVEAIKAIGSVGQKAVKVCYSDIFELLQEKDPGLVAAAAWALGEWGEAADKALPGLQKLYDAKDTDERLKPILKDAMERVQGKKKP